MSIDMKEAYSDGLMSEWEGHKEKKEPNMPSTAN